MADVVPGVVVSQDDSALIPSLIVFNFFTGATPNIDKLADLSAFAQSQYNYYASIGVGQPLLGPYEALGRGFAETDGFKTKYGVLTTDFVAKAYTDVFGKAPQDAQKAHFDAQISYFLGIYKIAGVPDADAALFAKGAVIGQMLGVASLDGGSVFNYNAAAENYLAQFNTAGFVPGRPLSNFEGGSSSGGGGGGGGAPPDTTAPIGAVDPLSKGDGTFKAGETIAFKVDFSENVVTTGAITLLLSNNGSAVFDAAASTASKLAFNYTVAANTNVADLEVLGLALPAL